MQKISSGISELDHLINFIYHRANVIWGVMQEHYMRFLLKKFIEVLAIEECIILSKMKILLVPFLYISPRLFDLDSVANWIL